MPIANSKKRRGTALLESIIAIGVILTGVVGTLVLLNTSINLGRANQDRIVAQNLAREGLELAYSLRNSASMRKVDDPKTNWYKYLHSEVLKSSNPESYLRNYNLGEVTGGVCKQRSLIENTATRTTENNDQSFDGSAFTYGPGVTPEAALACDLDAFVNYLFETGWGPPPACMGAPTDITRGQYCDASGAYCMTEGPTDCDYNGEGGADIIDVTYLVNQFYLNTFQFGFGYPTLAGASGKVNGKLDFYSTLTADGTTGIYPQDPIWLDTRAQVYTDNAETTYVQNLSNITGYKQTKYYRVVSMQAICRGTKSVPTLQTVELVIDADNAFNCFDYISANNGSGEVAEDWDLDSISHVGVLVSSEVRWPTPTSSTKARYQEFLYDWISI
ncbi:MAG: hypothetical protein AAB515_01080 [Patescibacteria group bacterium]